MGADSIALAASQCSKLLGFAGTSYQDIQRLPPSIAEVGGVLGRRSSMENIGQETEQPRPLLHND